MILERNFMTYDKWIMTQKKKDKYEGFWFQIDRAGIEKVTYLLWNFFCLIHENRMVDFESVEKATMEK